MIGEWASSHTPHLVGTGVLGGGGIIFLFRDALNKGFEEWRLGRKLAREATLTASGKDSQLTNSFIALLKSDLESQGRTREEMAKAISQLAVSMSQILDTQRILSNQLNDINRDILTLKGAVLGRLQ